ncbi:MAG: TetR family transcriptional regulator [Austwickia sp.]|nr:TetR family transcriptional regulator [Austwickia sp.]MCO5308492.1 TetR family transcriptional regulator [Austwickia sp.]
MTERRQRIGDAAVEVLAQQGLRGLTHRAVDAEAGLPVGSTSNVFRSRAALITGVIDRLAERDMSFLREFGDAVQADASRGPDGSGFGPLDLESAADLVGKIAVALTSPPMDRLTRARMMLAFEDSADLGPQHRGMLVVVMGLLSELGHPDPGATARGIIDYVDGAMFHALTLDTRTVDAEELAAMVRRLLAPAAVTAGSATA